MAAQECGAELEVLAPEREQDVEVQNKLLEEAIEKNPDAILFSPSSFDASDELLQEAKDKGIKITFIDSYTTSLTAKFIYILAILAILVGFVVYLKKKCIKK